MFGRVRSSAPSRRGSKTRWPPRPNRALVQDSRLWPTLTSWWLGLCVGWCGVISSGRVQLSAPQTAHSFQYTPSLTCSWDGHRRTETRASLRGRALPTSHTLHLHTLPITHAPASSSQPRPVIHTHTTHPRTLGHGRQVTRARSRSAPHLPRLPSQAPRPSRLPPQNPPHSPALQSLTGSGRVLLPQRPLGNVVPTGAAMAS